MDYYFDFEKATVPEASLDTSVNESCAALSMQFDFNELDSLDTSQTLDVNQINCGGPHTVQRTADPEIVILKLINDREVEAVRSNEDTHYSYPMFKARTSCKLCSDMGLDCYLAHRGVLIDGCTPCISLYRECSFTYPDIPKGYVNTFVGIAEDEQVNHGLTTEKTRKLASMTDTRHRKTGARFHRDAVRVLKQWLAEHVDHPYPNECERDTLKELTGLKRSQISNWLANARRREKARIPSVPASPVLGAVAIPAACSITDPELRELGPLERWKHSPPENEAATINAITQNMRDRGSIPPGLLTGSNSSRHNSGQSSYQGSSEDGTNMSTFRAPSNSSFGTRESSNSSLSLVSSSHASRASLASSVERRRRRRNGGKANQCNGRASAILSRENSLQVSAEKGSKGLSPTTISRCFQCTFCTEIFVSKYDWQRHEKSLHLALESWTCCPNGPIYHDLKTNTEHCVFCGLLNPGQMHSEEVHNHSACAAKPLSERTFYRKDHLRQHLKLVHSNTAGNQSGHLVTRYSPHMDTWKTSIMSSIKSRCGFCPTIFTDWSSRADHLAAHFRNGATMENWQGGWGFEPWVDKLVENSIPPYLIGTERISPDPYVARKVLGSKEVMEQASSGNVTFTSQMQSDSNCWNRLQTELINFVIEQKGEGITPSDKELQDRARLIIYGTCDGWDWTSADNSTWLNAFKMEVGLTNRAVGELPEYTETRRVPILAPYVIKGGLKPKRIRPHIHDQGPNDEASQRYITDEDHQMSANVSTSYGGLLAIPQHSNLFQPDNSDLPVDDFDVGLNFDSMNFAELDSTTLNEFGTDTQDFTMADESLTYLERGDSSNEQAYSASYGNDLRAQQHFGSSNHSYMPAQGHEMSLAEFDQLTGYLESRQ